VCARVRKQHTGDIPGIVGAQRFKRIAAESELIGSTTAKDSGELCRNANQALPALVRLREAKFERVAASQG
jgi:hypothetical protein